MHFALLLGCFARLISDILSSNLRLHSQGSIFSFKAGYQSPLSALPQAPGGTIVKNAELFKQPMNVTEA